MGKKATDLQLYERVYKSCYKEDGCLRKLTYSVKWVCVHCTIAMFNVYWTIQNLISNLISLFHSFSSKGLGFDNVWFKYLTIFGLRFDYVWFRILHRLGFKMFGLDLTMFGLGLDKVWFGFRGKKLRRAHSLQDRLHLSFYSRYM